jgi:hypothetical protein
MLLDSAGLYLDAGCRRIGRLDELANVIQLARH